MQMHEVVFTEEILAGEETLYAANQKLKDAKTLSEKIEIARRIKDFIMRNLIQAVEIATNFNFLETVKAHPGESVDFLKTNLHYSLETEGGKEFREIRWKVIWDQINSPLNKWSTGDDIKSKPDFFQRYCHYLRSSGLIKYWLQREKEKDKERGEAKINLLDNR
jgi:hypothetical protein